MYNISGFVLGAGKVAVDNALSNLTTQFLNTVRSIFYVSQQEDTNCKPKCVCNWNDTKYSRQDELRSKTEHFKVATVTKGLCTLCWTYYTHVIRAFQALPEVNTLHPALQLLSKASARRSVHVPVPCVVCPCNVWARIRCNYYGLLSKKYCGIYNDSLP